jgi:hypothetical protein
MNAMEKPHRVGKLIRQFRKYIGTTDLCDPSGSSLNVSPFAHKDIGSTEHGYSP